MAIDISVANGHQQLTADADDVDTYDHICPIRCLVLFWMAVSSDGLLSLRDAPRAWPPWRGNIARAPPGASGTHRVPLPPRIAASAKSI